MLSTGAGRTSHTPAHPPLILLTPSLPPPQRRRTRRAWAPPSTRAPPPAASCRRAASPTSPSSRSRRAGCCCCATSTLLDADDAPPLFVVGRAVRLPAPEDAPPVGADGAPAAPPPLPSAVEAAAAAAAADGPLVRLALKEWSVEYDELHAVVWASTEAADYRLLSADAQYGPTVPRSRRKTASPRGRIALLAENERSRSSS